MKSQALVYLGLVFLWVWSSNIVMVESSDSLHNQLRHQSFYAAVQDMIGLTDGRWSKDSSSEVLRVADTVTFGDLNHDGAQDCVIVLVENSGGSGAFVSLEVFFNQNGRPKQVDSLFLGDRIDVVSISIKNQVLDMMLKVHTPNDGLCCPSDLTLKRYIWEIDSLVEIQ